MWPNPQEPADLVTFTKEFLNGKFRGFLCSGNTHHCVKSVQIRNYSWSVFFCIRTEYGPEITPYLGIFHGVHSTIIFKSFVITAEYCFICEGPRNIKKWFSRVKNWWAFKLEKRWVDSTSKVITVLPYINISAF